MRRKMKGKSVITLAFCAAANILFAEADKAGSSLTANSRTVQLLELRGLPGKSFYLAGADGAFYPADKAEISGGSILLTSENVKAPLYVRYAWSDNPESILWNRQYPAAAFSSESD